MARLAVDNLTTVTGAYDANYNDKTIKAIDVLGPGSLFLVDAEDTAVTYTFAAFSAAGGAYSCFPYRLELRVKQIVGDGAGNIGDGQSGTDIALANLVVLH